VCVRVLCVFHPVETPFSPTLSLSPLSLSLSLSLSLFLCLSLPLSVTYICPTTKNNLSVVNNHLIVQLQTYTHRRRRKKDGLKRVCCPDKEATT
jgi:hypothetical protein